jgi:iron complex transport system substrate-binding protein
VGCGLIALLLSACGDGSGNATAIGPSGQPTHELTLADGSTVRVPVAPTHIIPASAGLVDLITALVPPERIAGLPRQALGFSGLRDPASPYLSRPQFEVYAAEQLLALHPDLILADRWQAPDTGDRLREAGVAVIEMGRVERLQQVRDALQLLARATATELVCEALLADMDQRLAALARSAPRRAGLRALAYTNGGTGGWAAGAGTTADEWITLAGMTNAAAETGRESHVRFTFEELLLLDPDVIIVSAPEGTDSRSGTAALLRSEPALASLAAVRNDRIVPLPAWLYNTISQHIVTAAELLAGRVDELAVETTAGSSR